MPKFCANLSMFWPEIADPYERFRAAARAGFARVERITIHDLDVERVRELLADLRLELVIFDPDPGNWEAGDRGKLAVPGREAELRETVLEALETAGLLGNRLLNVLAGITDAPWEAARDTAIANLTELAPAAQKAGVTLLVEALNQQDVPGFAVPTVAHSAEIVRAVDHEAVRMQFDAFHVARVGGDMLTLFREHQGITRHVQIADVPGRHQPGTGTLPIPAFLDGLDRLGYAGAVGLEYVPLGSTDAALEWLPRDQRG